MEAVSLAGVWPCGDKHRVEAVRVKHDEGIDLWLAETESDRKYYVTTISESQLPDAVTIVQEWLARQRPEVK